MAEQMMQHKADKMAAKQTIPAGYKQTEVGVIPEDWEVFQLGGLSDFVTSGSRGWAKYYSTSGALFIRSQNVRDGKLCFMDSQHVNIPQGIEGGRTKVKLNDLLVTITGNSVGNVALASQEFEEAYISQHVGLVRLKDSSIGSYVSRYLSPNAPGNLQIQESQSGQSKPGLNLQNLKDFLVAVPKSKEEAKKITSALDATEALIVSLELLIAKKQAIKTAAMQQLLTGRTRLPQFTLRPDGTPKGYKTSELGQIPEDWTIETLGGVAEIVRNGSNYSSVAKDGVAVTRIETIATGFVDVGRTGVAVRESIHESYRVLRGDILYSHINSIDHIGKVARFDDDIELFHGINLILIRTSAVNSLWLFKLLSGEEARKWARQVAKQAVSQASINTKELKGLLLAVPSTQEQTAIATILSDMDNELTALEQKLAKARDVKQGMMQQLLTGRIRLPVEQVE